MRWETYLLNANPDFEQLVQADCSTNPKKSLNVLCHSFVVPKIFYHRVHRDLDQIPNAPL